jgi:radical SAM protein with 4Fe4S-binding SPASM domain
LHDDLDKPNPNRIPSELFAETIKILYKELSETGRIPNQLLRRFEPLLTRTPNHYFCPAFSEKMVIAPDGTSGPCEGFAYSREYIYDWKDFFFNTANKRDEWLKSSPLQNEDCCQCPLILTCGGGCRYDAKIIYGSIKQLDEYRCIQEKELLIWFLIEFLPDYCQINIRKENMFFIINDEMRNDIYNKLKGLDINIAWR